MVNAAAGRVIDAIAVQRGFRDFAEQVRFIDAENSAIQQAVGVAGLVLAGLVGPDSADDGFPRRQPDLVTGLLDESSSEIFLTPQSVASLSA